MSDYIYKRNKRRKTAPILIIVIMVLFASAAVVFAAITVRKSNEIKSLKNETNTFAEKEKELNDTVSQQAAEVDELKAQLDFFATPEEGADDSESQIPVDNNANAPAQGDLFPNLYAASKNNLQTSESKTAYLTFDDGPSNLTPVVLDILDQYNAKATFFVIGTTNEEYQQYYSEIINRGHTLALHSYTHNYQKIYASVDAFMDDYNQLFNLIYDKTGYVCSLMRYPGGSKNSYNKAVRDDLIAKMQERGFIYYDWNVSCGDGSAKATKESVYEKVMNECAGYNKPVILMHDGVGHQATIDALPQVLQSLSEQGYTFSALTVDNAPVQFPR